MSGMMTGCNAKGKSPKAVTRKIAGKGRGGGVTCSHLEKFKIIAAG